MSSTRWNDQHLFLTTLKIRISPKTLLFSDERGSDTNLLVGETTSGGSDTNCWGFLLPLRNGGVHDHFSKEAKHTDTIFNVVRLIAYIHGRDQYY